MTPLERSFLDAILLEPERDDLRLIYADWLEESATDPVHAALIRTQIELAGYKRETCPNRHEKTSQMLSGYPVFMDRGNCGHCRWCQLKAESDRLTASISWHRWRACIPAGSTTSPVGWGFRRGFLADLRLPASAWVEYGEAILRTWPIEWVEISEFQLSPYAGFTGKIWGITAPESMSDAAWIYSWLGSNLLGTEPGHAQEEMTTFASVAEMETAVTAACFRTIAVKIGAAHPAHAPGMDLPTLRRLLLEHWRRPPAPNEPREVLDARRLVK